MGGSGRAAVPTWGGDVGVDRLCSYGYKRIAAGTRKRFDLHKRHSFTRYTDMARVGLATASMLTHTASFYRCGERCRGGWLCKLLVFLGLRRERTQLHCVVVWLGYRHRHRHRHRHRRPLHATPHSLVTSEVTSDVGASPAPYSFISRRFNS